MGRTWVLEKYQESMRREIGDKIEEVMGALRVWLSWKTQVGLEQRVFTAPKAVM